MLTPNLWRHPIELVWEDQKFLNRHLAGCRSCAGASNKRSRFCRGGGGSVFFWPRITPQYQLDTNFINSYPQPYPPDTCPLYPPKRTHATQQKNRYSITSSARAITEAARLCRAPALSLRLIRRAPPHAIDLYPAPSVARPRAGWRSHQSPNRSLPFCDYPAGKNLPPTFCP